MRRVRGFTLVELLIAMVVVGILTAIAMPSYQHYITRARRLEATTHLIDLAATMERYYTEHQSYKGAIVGKQPPNWYHLKIAAQSDSGYDLEAIPIGHQLSQDKECRGFTLNSIGVHDITGSGNAERCWA